MNDFVRDGAQRNERGNRGASRIGGLAPPGDRVVAVVLGVLVVMVLTATAPSIGLTWDEPTYFVAAESYMEWLHHVASNPRDALGEAAVRQAWEYNNESPPLSKLWSGLIWLGARHVFDDLTAHRLGNILLVGLLVALVYLMVAGEYGRGAGMIAVSALMTMPRFFFHAHLAALDVPVAVMIFAVIALFWHVRDSDGLKSGVLLGVVWGLALSTKINALVIPPVVFLLYALMFARHTQMVARLVIMGVVGGLVHVATWPWMYYDTWNRMTAYLDFMTVNHSQVEQMYFNELMSPPPWHFPVFMTVAVVPFSLMTLASLGAVRAMLSGRRQPLGWLLMFAALASVLPFTTGRSQVFDNERLFMPVFPFLAALAGIGFDWGRAGTRRMLHAIGKLERFTPAVAFAVALVFVPHVVLTVSTYPHLLSYYSEGIGGMWGARYLRLETTYWCEAYRSVIPHLNRSASPGATVWAECHDVLTYYQQRGELRRDLVGGD